MKPISDFENPKEIDESYNINITTLNNDSFNISDDNEFDKEFQKDYELAWEHNKNDNPKEKLLNSYSSGYSTNMQDIDLEKLKKRKEKLNWWTMLSFACPLIGIGGMNLISTTSASFFYTDILGLSAKTVGNVQLTLMFTYALSEPIFGWISDISSCRLMKLYGKRKPFLLISSIIQALSFFLLLNPPKKVNTLSKLKGWSYLCSIIFGMSLGCSEVAHHSLASQLTYDYDERSKLQFISSIVALLGSTSCGLLNGILGSVFISSWGDSENNASQKNKIFILSLTYSVLYIIGVIITLLVIHKESIPEELYHNETADDEYFHQTNLSIIKNIFKNKPFRLLLMAYSFTLLSGAVSCMLLPYFCRYVLQSNFLMNWSPLFFTTSAIIAFPLSLLCSRMFHCISSPLGSKRWKYILSAGLLWISLCTCSFVVQKNNDYLFILFCIISGLSVGSFFSTPEAMKADVIDYDEFLNGTRSDAKYSGLFMCFANLISGLGMKFALYYINYFGYENSKNIENNQKLIWAIRTAVAGFITLTFLVIFFTMIFYPIDRIVHKNIIEGTKLRKNGKYAVDPLNPRRILPPFVKRRE